MLFLEVQMKLNFLQFDVLNVKIQAQEVRRWFLTSQYCSWMALDTALLVVLLRLGELLGRQEVALLAAAVLEALFGHLSTFFCSYTSPNTPFYERITSALTALHYFSFVKLFLGRSYEGISSSNPKTVPESWDIHHFGSGDQLASIMALKELGQRQSLLSSL